MPVLIALSFRETSLWSGLVLFTGIVMIGIGLRAYFNGLQLLIVPRLAAVLSIVSSSWLSMPAVFSLACLNSTMNKSVEVRVANSSAAQNTAFASLWCR